MPDTKNIQYGSGTHDFDALVINSTAAGIVTLDSSGNDNTAYEIKQLGVNKLTIQKDGSASLPDCIDDDITSSTNISTLSKSIQVAGKYRAASTLSTASITLLKTDNGSYYEITSTSATITITLDATVVDNSWFDFYITDTTEPAKQITMINGTQTISKSSVTGSFRIHKWGINDTKLIMYSGEPKVADSISDGVTTIAPSQNAVYDAIQPLKSVGAANIIQVAGATAGSFADSGVLLDSFSSGNIKRFTKTVASDNAIVELNTTDAAKPKVSLISVNDGGGEKYLTNDGVTISTNLPIVHSQATLSTESATLGQVDAKVADSISDGVTTIAPSQNAVFDALAGKANTSHTQAWSTITSTPTLISGYGISDAYTKTQVDAFLQGLKPKAGVKAATTGEITLSGHQTLDTTIAVVTGDRVLVKNQGTGSENGIYVVDSGPWTRAVDADSATELTGSYCFVEQGSTLADTQWACVTDNINLGVTPLVYVQTSGTGAFASVTHTHGNITNDGKVGTTSGLPLITGTNGLIQAGSFGSTPGTFTEGSASLASINGLSYVSSSFVKMTAANTFTLDTNSYSLTSHNHSGVYEPVIASKVSTDPNSFYYGGNKQWVFLNTLYSSAGVKAVDAASPAGTPVNYWTFYPSSTGNALALWAAGTDTDISMQFRTKGTGQLYHNNGQTIELIWNAGNDGTGSGLDADLLDGNHASAFAGSNHTHGNITNDGKVGTTSGIPLITGTAGLIQAGSFSNTAGSFAEGNDSRFLSTTDKTDLTDGGASTLHYHASDRDRTNHTGTQLASTISDFSSAAQSAAVAQTITNGVTTSAPSQDAVYDALALKRNFLANTTSEDLNTMTGEGLGFKITAVNKPTGAADGWVEQIGTTGARFQRYIESATNATPRTWVRKYNNTSWTSWKIDSAYEFGDSQYAGDLNVLLNGLYYVDSGTATNYPATAGNGWLWVTSRGTNTTVVLQEYVAYTGTYRYSRTSIDSGVNWSAWVKTANDADKVAKAGDTMTGQLKNTQSGTTNATSALMLESASPRMVFSETDAPLDEKHWQVFATGGDFYIRTIDDGEVGGGGQLGFPLWIKRTGALPTEMNIGISTASTSSTTGALVVAGGVGAGGDINAGGSISSIQSDIIAAAGSQSALNFRNTASGSGIRWQIRKNADAESTGNLGSNFEIRSWSDTGTLIDTPVTINRVAGGAIALVRPLTNTAQIKSTKAGSGSDASALNITSSDPTIYINDTNAAADEKIWEARIAGGDYIFRGLNDAETVASTAYIIGRTGGTVDNFSIPISTASTTAGTGALTVTGGVGIGGAVNAGARSSITTVSDSAQLKLNRTTTAVGSVMIGGAGDRDSTNTNDSFRIYNGAGSRQFIMSIPDTGALTIGATGGSINFSDSTASTTTTTGALTVGGGVGVVGALNVGGVCASSAINSDITTKGSTALITKGFADTYYTAAPMTSLGDIIYGSVAGTPATAARLAPNTVARTKVLTMKGTGTVGAAPAWNYEVQSKSITIPTPANTDTIMMWITDTAITLTKVVGKTTEGTLTATVNGNALSVTSTIGSMTPTTSAAIAANTLVTCAITSMSGVTGYVNITVYYTVD